MKRGRNRSGYLRFCKFGLRRETIETRGTSILRPDTTLFGLRRETIETSYDATINITDSMFGLRRETIDTVSFFGCLHDQLVWRALALLIGIFVQIIWEDKPVTQPL